MRSVAAYTGARNIEKARCVQVWKKIAGARYYFARVCVFALSEGDVLGSRGDLRVAAAATI